MKNTELNKHLVRDDFTPTMDGVLIKYNSNIIPQILKKQEKVEKYDRYQSQLSKLHSESKLSYFEMLQVTQKITDSHHFDESDCSKIVIPFRTYEDACMFSMKILDKELPKH